VNSDWTGKKVLVTGADGFIGSHLTEALLHCGAAVTGLAHYNPFGTSGWLDDLDPAVAGGLEMVRGDVQDGSAMLRMIDGHDTIFHLASLVGIPYSYESPSSYVNVNLNGTLNILNACRQTGVERIVHTSTSEVYGTAKYVPIDEDHPLQAQSPYAATKIGADALVMSFHKSFEVPASIVRPFNTYGPRQSARAVIPTLISQLLTRSERIKLGSIHPIRDFNFVADTVSGFLAVGNSNRAVGEVINLGSGRGVSIAELAELLMNLVGHRAKIETSAQRVRPAGSEVDRLICDPSHALELVGWKPDHTLEQGLEETCQWVRDHIDSFDPHVYAV